MGMRAEEHYVEIIVLAIDKCDGSRIVAGCQPERWLGLSSIERDVCRICHLPALEDGHGGRYDALVKLYNGKLSKAADKPLE